jgi:predicted peroxiredoxin
MKNQLKLMGQILLIVFALYGMFSFATQIISPSDSALADAVYVSEVSEALSQEAAPTPRAPEDLRGGFFVNLTTDDIDRAAMAIGLATKVRQNTGKPVTIFMNTQGVRLVDINIPQNTHKSGKTIHQMLQMFMDEGGVALVCPVCMKNVGGLSEIEILPGVIIGTPEYTWSAMFAEDVTVISY